MFVPTKFVTGIMSVCITAQCSTQMILDLTREKLNNSRLAKLDTEVSELIKQKLDLKEKNNLGLKE